MIVESRGFRVGAPDSLMPAESAGAVPGLIWIAVAMMMVSEG